MIRIAHLSDLHFFKLTLGLSQFFSKRWIGNLNQLFLRSRRYNAQPLRALPQLFAQQQVQEVIISGDFTCTSTYAEYRDAQAFVELLRKEGCHVLTIPGNHDHYTQTAYRQKRFYRFFANKPMGPFAHYTLEEQRMEVHLLGEGWWWVGLDTTSARPIGDARGIFPEKLEANLTQFFKKFSQAYPQDKIMLVNHYPLLPSAHPKHDLQRIEALQQLLKETPQVKLYLYGHDHQQKIQQPADNLPYLLSSGSCADCREGTVHLMELTRDQVKVRLFRWQPTLQEWQEGATIPLQLV